MDSASKTTLVRGRHRMGIPGLVHVTAFVAVAYRGLFQSWRVPGRHRRPTSWQADPPVSRVAPAPAV